MPLPTTKRPPKTDLRDYIVLLYGPWKIGKSTWVSEMGDVLFLATEPGLNDLEVYEQPIGSYDQFLTACAELAMGDHHYRTVCIDTIDNLYLFCQQHFAEQYGVTYIGDLDFGKGTHIVNAEMLRVLSKLASLPYGLVMTSHAKMIEVKTRTGKYNKMAPTLPESARKTILGMADIIAYCDIEQVDQGDGTLVETRSMFLQPSSIYEAGNRTQRRLPDRLPLDFHAFLSHWDSASVGDSDTDEETTQGEE
jgi:hypothetical protein